MSKSKPQPHEDHPVHWALIMTGALIIAVILPESRQLASWLFLAGLIGLPFSWLAFQKRKARTLKLRDLQLLTPRELEIHVARVLDALPGWSAHATRGSSDQGADVIATTPEGKKIAVQVKHYRNNVGNKAVQEIVASKALYSCEHAVVFTSGPGYTKAAVELAQANKVPLWGPSDLFRIQEAAEQGGGLPRDLLPARAAGWLGGP